ncbi:MAG TPA: FAD-binding oxidoreductase, partial [Chloroflexota bacterium]|nr:FAD-binding oxidoreductase [Chloroflexota bacterium]
MVEAHSESQVRDVVLAGRAEGRTIMSRGSGFSYGDPALNGGNLVLDLRPMNRVITWDEERGIIDLEPGVTVGDLCRHVASAGWWPPVLPGTKGPTMGGCAAANVHGKNNWKLGTFGEHVIELDFMLADGTTVTCGPEQDKDLFVAVLGGFGLLGVITRVRLQMQPGSGELHVEQYAAPELEDVMAIFERWTGRADYMVGWIDGFASGQSLGRGLVQVADTTESSRSAASMDRRTSWLRDSLRSHGHLALRPFATRTGLRAAAAAQYTWGALQNGRGEYITRERFHFFHDTIPNWNQAFP